MKITLALFAILAFIGLGQSHQFPDFGYGPLHEDFQDFLDLVPVKKIVQVAAYYAKHDSEVQAAINFLTTTPTLKNLVIDFESIPEVTEFINGLYGQNIDIYNILNQINRALEINELIPPWVPSPIPGEPTPTPNEPTSTSSKPTPTPTPNEPTPTSNEPTPTPSKPTPTPSEPTDTPSKPTATPSESTATSIEPTFTPSKPTATPSESTPTSSKPTATPSESTATPSKPTATPSESTPTSSKPTPTPTPTETSSPTSTPTTSPVPTSPSTARPTSSPAPTSGSTAGPTSSLVPTPTSEYKHFFYKHNGIKQKTGGLAGLFRDVKRLFNYDAFISVYVDKLKNSTPFVDLVNEIKSENFQVLVNKIFESQSVQIIQNGLKDKVNLKIVGDIFYLLFGITFPDHVKSLEEHFVDFFYLLPAQEMVDIVVKYLNEDKEVQNAVQFVTTSEFHDLLRATEALKEHQEFVLYLQNHGLNIIEQIKELHKAIGMEDYVPPKIENFLKAQIKTQEVGGGVKALLDDLYSLLPFEKIDALYEEKISKSKIFKDFYDAITSEEFVNLANNLAAQEPVKQLVAKSNEKGLDLAGFQRFGSRIIGFK
ncbi:rhoGEF domain-containing protein gxcI [Camponotus floridanus]|uniref:rhoGEF domain-containing protein gxcI n=1 Tax=Camponotus floridanus TaxID=104421 RepID=UPI000DC6BF92|nr:rhoGEF domain-containing protein gxcI [Camponotus floridanus]